MKPLAEIRVSRRFTSVLLAAPACLWWIAYAALTFPGAKSPLADAPVVLSTFVLGYPLFWTVLLFALWRSVPASGRFNTCFICASILISATPVVAWIIATVI